MLLGILPYDHVFNFKADINVHEQHFGKFYCRQRYGAQCPHGLLYDGKVHWLIIIPMTEYFQGTTTSTGEPVVKDVYVVIYPPHR